MPLPLASHALFAIAAALAAVPPAPVPANPNAIVAGAPAGDWAAADPADLMILDLAGGRRVTVLLAPAFAPAHVAAIAALARAHWYDGLAVARVQDGYVVQWGDADAAKPRPAGLPDHLPPEYDRPAAGLAMSPLGQRDTFAPRIGLAGAFPVAGEGARAWLAHCYGMVGVARGLNPDTGSGSELYAVIGQAPRQLDRNIALVGRVIDGFEQLTALPRGTAALGFYADPAQRRGIARVRLASELPPGERPAFQWLRPDSASFARWVAARANRHDDFFLRPAGAVDLCNALPPVRAAPKG